MFLIKSLVQFCSLILFYDLYEESTTFPLRAMQSILTWQNVDCPVTLRRKENTGIWTRILMSFNNFDNGQKDNPCTVSRMNGRKQLQMLK